ncbi:hypothetical protein [Oceanobacillus bengalensis]|uniref:Uncharacterized protein n=1 Tax=Oceanobacillus bengalensis TaxID=1435466 RepID=A0A494Z426_9BACI|nr:hypothetical protein [Oceanobacillus bengalensis]RKQ17063.1 hypothetical protein D8M05_05155 [Oceanobacillus bengalensis]
MRRYWNFPAATGGMINSINNAGLETFRGNALDSLTREICQNSLDAVKDTTKPVVVEFKRFTTNINQFPNKEELIQVFGLCEDTWRGHNKKSEDFIKEALKVMSQPEMSFLRISDFNTKGLEGAREGKLGSPWSSLVKEAGSSNKDESSGGSFGIGKSAPFLNSNLRTLFYSSYDVTGYKSHIGVANIMSFQKSDDQITLGNGYYTDNENSTAIQGQLQLDQEFHRESTGTDIYVSAFEPKDVWEEEVKKSILFNFFITVFQKKLVVRINDLEVNDRNIVKLISELEDNDENQILKNYFELLTSSNTVKIPYPAKRYKKGPSFEEGEAELLLCNGEDLNRRVLMTRKTGMRIFEQKNISGSISFTGILMITGTNMNNIFKQMENPAHNEWSPERYEKDPKLAKKIYTELRKFIRDTVKSRFQEQITDEMDAVGLSDFLPNTSLDSGQSVNKTESLNSTIKSIVTKEVKQETEPKPRRKGKDTKEIEEQLVGEFGITPSGNEGGSIGETQSSGGDASAGSGVDGAGNNELNPNEVGNTDKKRERKPSKYPVQMDQRYVCIDKGNGKYRFVISPKKNLESARLVFRVVGEQSNYDLPIKQAETDDRNVTVEKCSLNTVYLHSLKKNERFMLNVDIDYSDYCVMEVELYEN